MHAGVVVPLRSFTLGKGRLATELDDAQRAQLVRDMADRVADATGGRHVVVVSSAPDVVAWAHGRGFATIDDPGSLDASAHAGVEHVRAAGLVRVVIVHGDLPL